MDEPPELFSDFLALALPARATSIYSVYSQDLAATIEELRVTGVEVPAGFDRRLAWAIACNLGELPVTGELGTAQGTRRGSRSDQKRWTLNDHFADLWRVLTNRFWRSNPGHTSSLLNDLGLSVLCERKDDWQDPPSRPLDVRMANETFDYVYSTNNALVIGYLRKNFSGGRLNDPEATANEAWVRMYRTHWDPEASKRFLGLCRISTKVCLFARYGALTEIGSRSSDHSSGQGEEDGNEDLGQNMCEGLAQLSPQQRLEAYRTWCEQIGIKDDGPESEVVAKQLEHKVRECLDQMPPKRRLVAYMVWFEKMRAKDVAECLGMSEPAVSEHLKKAREELRDFLREHGFDVPSDEKKSSTGRRGA